MAGRLHERLREALDASHPASPLAAWVRERPVGFAKLLRGRRQPVRPRLAEEAFAPAGPVGERAAQQQPRHRRGAREAVAALPPPVSRWDV
jgi:hypothetical protein